MLPRIRAPGAGQGQHDGSGSCSGGFLNKKMEVSQSRETRPVPGFGKALRKWVCELLVRKLLLMKLVDVDGALPPDTSELWSALANSTMVRAAEAQCAVPAAQPFEGMILLLVSFVTHGSFCFAAVRVADQDGREGAAMVGHHSQRRRHTYPGTRTCTRSVHHGSVLRDGIEMRGTL